MKSVICSWRVRNEHTRVASWRHLCGIELHADDREEVVEDGLSLVEAEIPCLAKMGDIPRPAAEQALEAAEPENEKPKRRQARQLEMKL